MTYVILSSSAYFQSHALREIRRIHPQTICLETLSPQYLLLKAPNSFEHFTRPFRDKLPIYLHHLFPVHRQFKLKGNRTDIERILNEVRAFTADDFATQARVLGNLPYDADELITCLDGELPNKTLEPSGRILSILVTQLKRSWVCYMGLSWATQNLSPYTSGRAFYAQRIPNRAGLKLLEAIDSFDIRFRPKDHALDLGAAPGAWTLVMRRYGLQVTSVAPAPMYDFLKDDSEITHYPMPAEEFLAQCRQRYDILLNDMILDAQDSAHLMVAYAQHLRSQGIAIMTVKLRMRKQRRVLDHTLRILRQRYKIIRIRQLVSNQKEVTLFLRRQ
jgi:23S rRNA (cytidine2498-2'-O)-methyltransferase